MNKAIFFISTGRCGTQWIGTNLSRIYPDLAVVRHEPLRADYHPKRLLRCHNQAEQLDDYPRIKEHFAWIQEILRDKHYIEVGWPAYAIVPSLVKAFPGTLKLVHLVRNPVFTSISLLTHNFYRPELRNDDYIKLAQLEPSDPGIILKSYRERWDLMTPYEKCLFHWTEINRYALEVNKTYSDIPFLSVKFEDVVALNSGALRKLIAFLALPYRPEIEASLKVPRDSYRRTTDLQFDWRAIHEHRDALSLSERFGYTFSDFAGNDLNSRYRRPLLKRIKRRVLTAGKRLFPDFT